MHHTNNRLVFLSRAYMACLFLYILLKAAIIPFTFDEAYTFLHYVHQPVRDIMRSPAAFDLANNHVLNTLLIKAALTAGSHPLLLRLPNVLAAVLYLGSARGIARCWYKDRFGQLILLMALSLNPMLSEFFALARGYGLGIAFMTYALWQLMLLIMKEGRKEQLLHTHLCLTGSIAAAYSSFSFLLPGLAIMVVLAGVRYRQRCTSDEKATAGSAGALLVPLCYALLLYWLVHKPISYLIAAKALFHGGNRNFVIDTWTSMISDLAGLRPHAFAAFDKGEYPTYPLLAYVVISLLMVLISFFIVGKSVIRERGARATWPLLAPPLLLTGCIAGINLQFYLQGTPFINYRVALYLYPLAILTVFAALKAGSPKHPAIARCLGACLTIVLFINFCLNFKMTYTTEWPFDAYNRQVCNYIAQQGKIAPPRKTILGSYSLMAPSLTFYALTQHPESINVTVCQDSMLKVRPQEYDYLYLPQGRMKIPADRFRLVAAYEDSTYLLYRRKE